MLDSSALAEWGPDEEAYHEESLPKFMVLPMLTSEPAKPKSKRGRPPKQRHPFDLPRKKEGRGRPKLPKEERDPLLASVADDARAIMKLWRREYDARGRHVRNDAVDLAIERWANILGCTPVELNDNWVEGSTQSENPRKTSLSEAAHDTLRRTRERNFANS